MTVLFPNGQFKKVPAVHRLLGKPFTGDIVLHVSHVYLNQNGLLAFKFGMLSLNVTAMDLETKDSATVGIQETPSLAICQ